jgi:hypothetical protein
MPLSIELVQDPQRLAALAAEWTELARTGGDGALFRGPEWILPWWHHFGPAMEAQLFVLAGWDGARLVGLAPFYERVARMGPGVKAREIRLLGDAGARPPSLDLLVASGYEERFAAGVVEHLAAAQPQWDVIDLAPLRDPSRARAYLAEKLDASGRKVDTQDAGSTLVISLSAALFSPDALPPAEQRATVVNVDGSLD